MPGSGNGTSRFDVSQSPAFQLQRVHLVDRWPRLERVFAVVVEQLRALPEYRATKLIGKTWLYKTRPGADVPSLWIYYEIDGRTVRLQRVLAEGRESFVL